MSANLLLIARTVIVLFNRNFLLLEQWQRPRTAQVAPFSSDLPEHFFRGFAWGRGGNGVGCSADFPL